ncbi:23S rRNA (uracil(1939)-C(5))-methyltransferase RlmD [Lacticaseibacillus pabuli]|uniref:23S rRNA (Uracil(1939)-C(5))-methyltransferase RlmD n=1 Tax=Lacticaseibacillus pabuli TaxID=3025672 RepID=A0ABY7WTL9_9LACO|nr:23S rRNA (uracil(1939)-C(5))-methyltransferase RlmD [Lacticaseibacillus sp. KACC 23028]WDF83461.1 23S rRNA (uracil(1939)-C(5))-methyltransferase RlmD [Lacticaseibacillus sp. KACC 23028]
MANLAKNQELEVNVTDLTYEGLGVAKVDGFPLFIDNALPGETVRAHITKLQKQYGFAFTKEILKKSPDRVETKSRIYTQTGIAPLQHLSYPAQLTFKQHQIDELYKKQHLDIEVLPTIPSPQQTGYRDKAQVPVREVNGKLETGFFKRRSHVLVPITDFYIQDPAIDEAIVIVRDLLRKYNVPAYDEIHNGGVVRNVMVRRGHFTKMMMIVLVTRTRDLPHMAEIVSDITAALPEVASIILNFNPKRTNVILGSRSKTVWGQDYIEDDLLGSTFRISAQSFYQVNPEQTENLYKAAIDGAQLTGNETVIDAYSGIGTISLTMARHAKQVYGVEVVPEAVEDARVNAAANGIKNVTFKVGKAEDVMRTWRDQKLAADVLMVDPPRKGLAPEFTEAVGSMLPGRIVYVSCNPATLARDITALGEFGYKATQTQPVDMFPQTQHIESVTVLTRD